MYIGKMPLWPELVFTGSSTDATPTADFSGLTNGDLVLVFVAAGASPKDFTLPALPDPSTEWVELYRDTNERMLNTAIYGRLIDGTEVASYDLAFTDSVYQESLVHVVKWNVGEHGVVDVAEHVDVMATQGFCQEADWPDFTIPNPYPHGPYWRQLMYQAWITNDSDIEPEGVFSRAELGGIHTNGDLRVRFCEEVNRKHGTRENQKSIYKNCPIWSHHVVCVRG